MQINSTGYSFISMYQSYPSYHGASDISYNLFNEWPNKNKVLIQITKSKTYKKKIINIKKKNGLIGILINIFLISLNIKKFLKDYKKKYLIIEGASWVGFSLILIIFIKILFKNIIIIYHAHNLEYEVRKIKNNFIISYLSFFFEKLIYKICVGTSVSTKDKKFVHENYHGRSILFENGVTENKEKKINNKKIKKNKFILFCGSYTYWPNKLAINKIIKNKPIIEKVFPNIKLIFTGEGLPNYKNKNILNLGIIKKSNLVWLIKNCLFFYAPMPKAPGTKIKILEALYYGATTLCSRNAIIGIKRTKQLQSLIVTSENRLFKNLIKIKNKKKIKISNEFKKYYNFKKRIQIFYEKINKL